MLIRYLGIGSVALLCGAALFQIVRPSVPIIKTVWAVEGEQICRQNQQVTASDRPPLVALSHDSLGRSLPSKDGCNVLAKGEVFLVSTDVQTSFDSRYFGPVAVSDLLGPVRYLGRWRGRDARLKDRRETGEGAGHG